MYIYRQNMHHFLYLLSIYFQSEEVRGQLLREAKAREEHTAYIFWTTLSNKCQVILGWRKLSLSPGVCCVCVSVWCVCVCVCGCVVLAYYLCIVCILLQNKHNFVLFYILCICVSLCVFVFVCVCMCVCVYHGIYYVNVWQEMITLIGKRCLITRQSSSQFLAYTPLLFLFTRSCLSIHHFIYYGSSRIDIFYDFIYYPHEYCHNIWNVCLNSSLNMKWKILHMCVGFTFQILLFLSWCGPQMHHRHVPQPCLPCAGGQATRPCLSSCCCWRPCRAWGSPPPGLRCCL